MVGELADRRGDLLAIVGDDAAFDGVAVRLEQSREQVAARILARALVDTVRNREDGGLQTGSFVFETSVTSVTTIDLSTALAMS
jgi:hypothetical protein